MPEQFDSNNEKMNGKTHYRENFILQCFVKYNPVKFQS